MRMIDADAAYKAACEGADNWDGGCSPYRDDCIREEMDKVPAASPWHRVEDGLPKDGQFCLFFTNESGRPDRDAWLGIYRNDWKGDIDMGFDYWMPIEPPKE